MSASTSPSKSPAASAAKKPDKDNKDSSISYVSPSFATEGGDISLLHNLGYSPVRQRQTPSLSSPLGDLHENDSTQQQDEDASSCHSMMDTTAGTQTPQSERHPIGSAVNLQLAPPAAAPSANRMVPHFVHSLVTCLPAQQRVHLRTFLQNLDDFLTYCGPDEDAVTDDDWRSLLVHLFAMMRRRGGLTPLQTKMNNDCSEVAFLCLCKILSSPQHDSFARVLSALQKLLDDLECTVDKLFASEDTMTLGGGQSAYFKQKSGTADASVPVEETPEEDETRPLTPEPETVEIRNRVSTSKTDIKSLGKKGIDLYFYTLDSLKAHQRGQITEADFAAVEEWYALLQQDSSSKAYLVTEGIVSSNYVVGNKFLPKKAFSEWETQFPSGTATLADVVKFLYRDVPDTVIQRRIEGTAIDHEVTDATVAKGKLPDPYVISTIYALPVPHLCTERLLYLQRTGLAKCDVDTVQWIKEWFDWIDFAACGYINKRAAAASLRDVVIPTPKPTTAAEPSQDGGDNKDETLAPQMDLLPAVREDSSEEASAKAEGKKKQQQPPPCREHIYLGDWDLMPLFVELSEKRIIKEDKADPPLTFAVLINFLFPNETKLHVDRTIERSQREVEWKRMERNRFREEENRRVKDIEHAHAVAAQPMYGMRAAQQAAASQQKGGAKDAGQKQDPITKLTVEMRLGLRRRVVNLRQESQELCCEELRQAMTDAKRREQMAQRNAQRRAWKAHLEALQRKNVPQAFGPVAPPVTVTVESLTVNPTVLQLDHFIFHSPEYRPLAKRILTVLSHSDICANFLLSEPCKLHTLVPDAPTSMWRVYRDFAFCSRRPPTGVYWGSVEQSLHIKTNIPVRSDIRYRIHIEGYNFGVNAAINTIVVGFASRSLDTVNALESYGWPDGWDRFTTTHYANGIRSVTQYVTSDKFVAFHCKAKSFINVGFGMSAWIATPKKLQNGKFHIAAEVFHQEENL